MKRMTILLISCCVVFFILISFTHICLANEIVVNIDAAKDLGPAPPLISNNVWIANSDRLANKYIFERFLRENRPAVIQLTLRGLRLSKNFEDFKFNLRNYLHTETVANLIREAKQKNTYLIVGFETASMPNWISAKRGIFSRPYVGEGWSVEQSSPPRDYRLWSKIVSYTLASIIEEYSVSKLGFFVGHEPDGFWFGDESSFFKFYEYAARGVKTVNPSIKVGGIGTQSVMQTKVPCSSLAPEVQHLCTEERQWSGLEGQPMLKSFISYVAKHNIPLDFVNWHSFNVLPADLLRQAGVIRTWLRENGLDGNQIILYPSDWSYWSFYVGGYPADYLDTEETAAYAIHALAYMMRGGIVWHGHDLDIDNASFEKEKIKQRRNSTFIGDWRIFTRNGITKPVYNALKVADLMARKEQKNDTPRLVETNFASDDTVVAISVVNNDKVYVLLSNFVPQQPTVFRRYFFAKIANKFPHVQNEIESIRNCILQSSRLKRKKGQLLQKCTSAVRSKMTDPKKIEALGLLAKVRKCATPNGGFFQCIREVSRDLKYKENIAAVTNIEEFATSVQRSKTVSVQMVNLPFIGDFRLTTYTIDSKHSNACRFNKRTEPRPTSAPCGVGGAVDQALWKLRGKARKEAVDAASQYLLTSGYNQKMVYNLQQTLADCQDNIRECLNESVLVRKIRSSGDAKRARNDALRAIEMYKDVFYQTYYFTTPTSVDNLNNSAEIALEGSEQIHPVKVSNGRTSINLLMEPNSIHFLILDRLP